MRDDLVGDPETRLDWNYWACFCGCLVSVFGRKPSVHAIVTSGCYLRLLPGESRLETQTDTVHFTAAADDFGRQGRRFVACRGDARRRAARDSPRPCAKSGITSAQLRQPDHLGSLPRR